MRKKILVMGLGQSNFLSFLYSSLKSRFPLYTITVPVYTDINKKVAYDNSMYENENVKHEISIVNWLKSLSVFFSNHLIKTFVFILFVEFKILKALNFVFCVLKSKAFFLQNNSFQEYDVFHFHFIQYSYIREVFLVPKNKKIVCSFWGSDLLRTSDLFNFYYVQKVLARADIITCQSVEMSEIILSKFGRGLSDKIKVNVFPLDKDIFDIMDINTENQKAVDKFKEEFNFHQTKINIQIGHNASPNNNHIKIIENLVNLKCNDKIHLIINLNYGLASGKVNEYKNLLIIALAKTNISYTILQSYFTKEELALSRLATQIFIHAPISDALSGTLTEMLYAHNIIITGAWLPYSTFTKIGIHFNEIDSIDQTNFILDDVLSRIELEKKLAIRNHTLIKQHFFSIQIIENWALILS